MTDPHPQPLPVDAAALAAQPGTTGLTDGEWHRLHPATPLLKGGIALLAIIGVLVYNFRDTLINAWLGGPDEEDPITWLIETQGLGIIALGVAAVLVILVIGFLLSWRFHTFRVTDEVVEVRSGILFRTHRKGRLDRVQGVTITRPFLARLVGAARLDISVAGQDANVQLAYLHSSAADDLRAEVLRLASGTRERAAAHTAGAAAGAPAAGLLERRVGELLAPELDPALAARESIVPMHPGRLVGSLLLSSATVWLLIMATAFVVTLVVTGEFFLLFTIVPAAIGIGSFYVRRFTRFLRYTIAATPDGIRVGYGLLSTANDTLPPGRIHSVQVSQPLLWRPAGWWEIKVNRASRASAQDAANGQQNTTILPVGTREEALRVLALLLPAMAGEEAQALLGTGLDARGGDFTTLPRRAAVFHWFAWRRNGFRLTPDAVLLRRGAIWRQLVVVPLARVQSVAVHRGPIGRRLRLATLMVHTVAGPITPYLGSVAESDAVRFLDEAAAAAVASAERDTSHHWGRA